jgi:mannose-6-phosphate isomerase-like protein (cupin superfamily)
VLNGIERIDGSRRGYNVEKVNLKEKLNHVRGYWRPYIVAQLNGQQVKVAKLKGEFIWHQHEDEDEMFLVLKGRFCIEFRDRTIWLDEGEFVVVPHGVEHRPVAHEETQIMLFEPASTLNTGNLRNERTVQDLERI